MHSTKLQAMAGEQKPSSQDCCCRAKLQQEQTRRELSEDRALEQAKRAAAVNAELAKANNALKQQQRLSKAQVKLCCIHAFFVTIALLTPCSTDSSFMMTGNSLQLATCFCTLIQQTGAAQLADAFKVSCGLKAVHQQVTPCFKVL